MISGQKLFWQCDRCGAICPEDKKMYVVLVQVEHPYMKTVFGAPMIREMISRSSLCKSCAGVIGGALAPSGGENG